MTPVYQHTPPQHTHTHKQLTSPSLQVGPRKEEVKSKVGQQRLIPTLGWGQALFENSWAIRSPRAPEAQSAHYLGLEDFNQVEKFYHTACLPSGVFYSQLIASKFQLDSQEFEPQSCSSECHTQVWMNRDIFQEVVFPKESWGEEGMHLGPHSIPFPTCLSLLTLQTHHIFNSNSRDF